MKIRKFVLALIFYLVVINFSFAQLSGIYTIGGVNPDFNTIAEIALPLSNPGLSGDVVFNIRPGIYNESVDINTGGDQYSVTFQSENSDSSSVIITCDSCTYTLNLNVDHCIVKNLTISGSIDYHPALKNNGKRLSVENCVIRGIHANTDTMIIENNKFFDEGSSFLYCDSLVLTNNQFLSVASCSYSNRALIVRNYFEDFVDMGHSDKIAVEENYFENECSILYCDTSLIANNIFNNEFRFRCLESQIVGNQFRFNDGQNITNNISYSRKVKIIGNIIFGLTKMSFCDSGKVFNNFFLSGLALGYSHKSLIFNNNFSGNEYSYLDVSSSNCVVKNNNLSQSVYGWIYNNSIENNNYYPSGGLYDLSPTNFDPQYIDTVDIHAQNPMLSGIGISLPQVQYDIDSIFRPTPPTMGANEICLSNDTIDLFCGDSLMLSFCNTPESGNFSWNSANGLSNSNIARPKASPATSTLYILTETQSGFTDSVFVNVIPYQVQAFSDTLINCGDSIYLFASHNASATYQWTPATGLFTPNSIHTIAKPNETISYIVSSAVAGCGVTYDTVTITVDPLPRIFLTYTPSCLTAIFQNNSTCASDYYWDFGDNTTSTEIAPSHTYDTSGIYIITLIAYNNFGSDTLTGSINLNCNTSSIPQTLGNELNFEYYPNPTSGNLTLKFDYGNTSKEVGIQLIDITGREIYAENKIPVSGKYYHTIDISSNANGIYFLKIRIGNDLTSYKVILSK